MVSLLAPTRKRPDRFVEFYKSVMNTADKRTQVEVVAYIDDDDNSYDEIELPRLTKVKGAGLNLSQKWNMAYENSKGDYLGMGADDVIFRTKGWDTIIKKAIDQYPDKIAFVFGDDSSPSGRKHGTHGFIHRNWAEATGYFVPPYFADNYVDLWLNVVANMIGRKHYVDIFTEHMHFGFDKSDLDDTYEKGRERAHTGVSRRTYDEKTPERELDAQKLREFINGYKG